jgi:hypothetical protein
MSASAKRIVLYLPWADALEPAPAFLARLPALDVSKRVPNAADLRLVRMARLDCDWHGEHARCMEAAFPGARVVGAPGLAGFLDSVKAGTGGEEVWFVITGQHPQGLGALGARLFAALRARGVRILYYAFDEASRTMPCFAEIAPHLDVLIHDEAPLGEPGAGRLAAGCRTIHRSWVANVVGFAAPFVEEPEERILFLGSQLGMTEHRRRQIDFLARRYGGRFTAIADHSVAVADRAALGSYKVGLCPEGRRFTSATMGRTHTDRPFWSGCMGMVPVSEDSKGGGRLEALARQGLILRYGHGNLEELGQLCDRALAMGRDERRRIYDHFNREETIGAVIAGAIGGG